MDISCLRRCFLMTDVFNISPTSKKRYAREAIHNNRTVPLILVRSISERPKRDAFNHTEQKGAADR